MFEIEAILHLLHIAEAFGGRIVGKLLLLVAVTVIFSSGSAFCGTGSEMGTIDPYSGKPCARCHKSKITGSFLHGALEGNNCAACHKLSNGNHQQDHSYSDVKFKDSDLCNECHSAFSAGVSVHSPISEKDCLSCHTPHTSAYRYLLTIPSDKLCFKCHEQSDLTGKNAAQKTAFRNKGENLHLLHVKKGGISCLSCHSPHKSNQSHLISDRKAKDKSSLEIRYSADKNGGSCTSSCHDKLDYSR